MANEFVIKNGYFSQGNSNVTGSLQVTGSVGVTGSASITGSLTSIGTSTFSGSVLMTGSLNAIVSGAIDLTGFITASKIFITSSGNEQLMVMGSGSNSWITGIYGSQGNLLTVTDTFSGSIFTVSDISGYPILDITSNYYTSSVYLPTLTTDPQQYVVTYNSESGQLFYSTPSSINGGAGGPNLSVQFNSASLLTGSDAIYITNVDGPSSVKYDHLRLDNAWLTIRDSSNNILFTTDGLTLGDGSGYASLEWGTRVLYDSAGTQSIQYDTRQLTYPHDPSLVPLIAIDWGTANQVTISGSVYTPNLTNLSQVNAIVIDTASGQLYYLPTSSIGGGSFNSTSSIIGNGLSSSFNINHGFNTLNLHITVYSASGTYENVYPDIRRINANTASIVFANPPLTDQYIVYISQ